MIVINKMIITKKRKREMKMNSKELKEIRELLIIVDMVNGFVREGVLHD